MLCIDCCIFAEHCQDLLKPKDVAYTYAPIAMAIFQSVTGKKVKNVESDFTLDGAETVIEPMNGSKAQTL